MSDCWSAAQALADWVLDHWISFALILAFGVYLRGFLRLRRRKNRSATSLRALAFGGGVATLGVALASPIHELGERLLQVHMLQHVLLMMVAPPLLWLGWPLAPILLGLPRSLAHPIARIFAVSWVKWTARTLCHPVSAWLAFAAVMWGWHIPASYELALRSGAWHHVEHASFLAAALLFWRNVVEPWPSASAWPRWSMIPYLALADVQNTALCALLTFSDRVWYKTYALLPRPFGLSPLEDQATAGTIMWILGSAVLLAAVGCIVRELLVPGQGQVWPREPLPEVNAHLGGTPGPDPGWVRGILARPNSPGIPRVGS